MSFRGRGGSGGGRGGFGGGRGGMSSTWNARQTWGETDNFDRPRRICATRTTCLCARYDRIHPKSTRHALTRDQRWAASCMQQRVRSSASRSIPRSLTSMRQSSSRTRCAIIDDLEEGDEAKPYDRLPLAKSMRSLDPSTKSSSQSNHRMA